MTTFPTNPGTALMLSDIISQLEYIHHESLFAVSIVQGIRSGRGKEAVREVYQQSLDNRNLVSDIIGEKLLRKIENYYNA